jgi:hypothetical protein
MYNIYENGLKALNLVAFQLLAIICGIIMIISIFVKWIKHLLPIQTLEEKDTWSKAVYYKLLVTFFLIIYNIAITYLLAR